MPALAGCALWLRSTQDDLQPVHPMEQAWCFQSHSDGTSRAKRRLGSIDDRYNPSQSASHRRQSAQKGALPRYIGRSRGGLTTKLHVVCDGKGRPVRSEEHTSELQSIMRIS